MNNMNKNLLASIFADTQNLYKTNEKLVLACQKSKKEQKIYLSNDEIQKEDARFDCDFQIVVSKKRTFEAAADYARAGLKTCVLNFANSFCPGGGVIHGARAQEECLCRVSTLYDAISSDQAFRAFYAPHRKEQNSLANDDVIFTPNVVVFKSDTDAPTLLPQDEWFCADVLTCAAPDLYDSFDISDDFLRDLFRSRIRRILLVAEKNKCDALVLGAFGCGAFGNSPQIVAEVFKEELVDFSRSFSKIEFAVYCSSRDVENFRVFEEVFVSHA